MLDCHVSLNSLIYSKRKKVLTLVFMLFDIKRLVQSTTLQVTLKYKIALVKSDRKMVQSISTFPFLLHSFPYFPNFVLLFLFYAL